MDEKKNPTPNAVEDEKLDEVAGGMFAEIGGIEFESAGSLEKKGKPTRSFDFKNLSKGQ